MPDTETERYGPDEDAEYLSVFWGILRVPVACADCGTRTRTPCYGEDGRRLCGGCYRAEMWPAQSSAPDVPEPTPDPPPSAPDEALAAARPAGVAGGRGKGRSKTATASGRPPSGRRSRGMTGGTDDP